MKNKPIKLKAKVTFEWEYEAKPEHYLCPKVQSIKDITIEDIIELDKSFAEDDEYAFLDLCNNAPTVEITQIKEDKYEEIKEE